MGLALMLAVSFGSCLKLSKDREVEYGAAFALVPSGDIAAAQALADDLKKRFPEDTTVQFSYRQGLKRRR